MNKFSILKQSAIALALVAGVAATGTATAGSLGQATLTLNNFLFKNNATGATLSTSDFVFINFTDSTNLNPSLNGTFNPFGNTITAGVLGQNVVCVPSSCPAFLGSATPFANIAIPAAGNGSLAASNLTGAPVSGLPNPAGGTVPTPATAQTAGLSMLTTAGFADSSSTLRLQSTFSFSLAAATSVLIDFNSLVHLMTNINSGSGSASAATNWQVQIRNAQTGANVFTWAPDGILGSGITGGTEVADACDLNGTRGLFLTNGTSSYDCSGREAAFVSLLGQTAYTLTLSHTSNTAVTLVPEPESVMLLGLGLVGLALARRRGRK